MILQPSWFEYHKTMSLVMSFKSAMRTRRWDHKFSTPKFKPRFRSPKRKYPRPKR